MNISLLMMLIVATFALYTSGLHTSLIRRYRGGQQQTHAINNNPHINGSLYQDMKLSTSQKRKLWLKRVREERQAKRRAEEEQES